MSDEKPRNDKSKTFNRLGVFALVPIQIYQDKKLKPTDRDVYGAISSFQGANEFCTPSVEMIAERAGKTQSVVFLSLKRLEDRGWIRRTGAAEV
jgi:DNA-binding MarR family transcriptional regulator